ncbi:hypothetical protein [Brucella sp. IR073]|uniref:hypothetical protein n=1 Tax=unclassified Brucella TaxID=2632610 RepID=UPI003B985AB9
MGSLFKKPPKPEPVRMPDEEDPQTQEAEAQRRRQIAARSGRTSTMLSRQNGSRSASPGTTAYGNSFLGQAN